MSRMRAALAAVAMVLLFAWPTCAGERVLMSVVEGRVEHVETVTLDHEASMLVLQLEGASTRYALAPTDVLSDAAFVVAEGDRLRLRVFHAAPSETEAPLRVQKAMNLSRQRMLRLRTLQLDPLWERAPGPGPGPGRPARPGRPERGAGPPTGPG